MALLGCVLLVSCIAVTPVALPAADPSEPPPAPAAHPSEPGSHVFEEEIEVLGMTPVDGVGLELDRVPGNVQRATGEEIDSSQSLGLAQFLTDRLGSVHGNEAQGNSFQPDIQFRGFGGSPLLGASQGLAVYQDGVRLNEPFGDTVQWDLVPRSAIASLDLIPGSNPLFGLNALGGAFSIKTKTGFSHPGTRARVLAGSFAQEAVELETGAHRGAMSYFLTGNVLKEDGWRDFSPSEVRQLFANVGRRGDGGSWDLSVAAARNDLTGNGAVPIQLLEEDRAAIFTHPDETGTRLGLVTLRGNRLVRKVLFEGSLHVRRSDIDTFNGDDTPYEPCEEPDDLGFLCEEEDLVLDETGDPVLLDPEEDGLDAVNNVTETRQSGYGGIVQATLPRALFGRDNRLVLGVTYDRADARFSSRTELADLTADRGTEGRGIFVSNAAVRVATETRHHAVFLADTFSWTPRTALTLGARYNVSEIELQDRLGTRLDGRHRFARLNTSVGLSHQLNERATLQCAFGESSRTPTPVELTCADPEAPCRLPNAFVSDPPLDQVVTRTFEVGARGGTARLGWNLGVFHAATKDDILFISSGSLTSQGHFDNVGRTRRRGLEVAFDARPFDGLSWSLSYTLLDATFESPFLASSPNHPLSENGEIPVERGDRLPGIPKHNLKAGIEVKPGAKVRLGADLLWSTDQRFRGDEANLAPAVPGYTLVNVRGTVRLSDRLKAFAQVRNLFDNDYETFGVYGEPDEVLGSSFEDPRFLSPGAPRAFTAGIEVRLSSSSKWRDSQ